FGTYNISSGGEKQTWADIARVVFEHRGRSGDDVQGVSTAEYSLGKNPAPRPRHSVLSLERIEATGFAPSDGAAALVDYLDALS
ncbi:MAG: sugar nucleotide-binding protein, partial [Aquihabitans sp.]